MTIVKDNKKWFAIYVKSRNEKKVFRQLENMGIESFLPLITRIKRWSDRMKRVEEPLFRSYLFVRLQPNDETAKLNVRKVSGVVRFVSIEDAPVPVPDNQIAAIKTYIADNTLHEVNCEDYKEGELVIIKSGHMRDLIGRFVKINGKHRVIINIESVGQSLPIDVPISNIEVYKKEGI